MLPAQMRNPAGNIIMDTADWTKISGTFTAAGGERYMVIGSFWREAQCNAMQLGSEWFLGGYFIDDVLVCACEDTTTEQPSLYMPNIFSPNGDGENDVLFLRAEKVRESELVIYNRWGEEVFRSSSQHQGWDGRAGGRDCEAGVYVWHVRLVYENGASLSRAGNVSLVR
jgi:gliding motility-associated-like protein